MPTIKKILVPVDFSEASAALLSYAKIFAETNNAAVSIVSVAEDPYTYSGVPVELQLVPMQSVEDFTKKRMDDFLHENEHTLSFVFDSAVLIGHPAEKIVTYAAEQSVDLIIIGTHGYKGFNKMIFGSVAEKVIKMAPCPVLTLNTYKMKESAT